MAIATLTSKGQVTIPKEIRDSLHLHTGDNSLGDLSLMPIMKFEQLSVLQEFLRAAPSNNVDLSDLLIGCSAKGHGCNTVLTFDRKAAKYGIFELVD